MSWKKQAAEWLRHKAELQALTNKAYPDHAKAYPSWAERIRLANGWAAELEYGEEREGVDDAGWTCFHCGETFTDLDAARDHFGASQTAAPGCLVKVSLGAERGLLTALREAEDTIARYMEDDTELHRALYQMQSRHSGALRTAEEAGYERGLKDGRSLEPQP